MPQSVQVNALVVDDDPLILAILSRFLDSRGWRVATVPDGKAALEALDRDDTINLVVTDRVMPVMDGLALARAIRARPSKSYVYCIMLTSASQQESLVAAMEAGVDDFVGKPVSLPELGARLHAAERVLALEAGLAARNESLAKAYAQLSRELDLARELQVGQLPLPAAFGNLRFEGLLVPSSFVGGDMFDWFRIGTGHVAFHVVDVSGHGVAAAMLAFNAQNLVHTVSQEHGHLLAAGAAPEAVAKSIVTEFNRRFLAMKDTSLYLTLAFGIADMQTGDAALVQAGHPAPLHAAAPGAAFRAIGEGGVPIGMLPDPGYESLPVKLAPGARLAIYSDGITECTNAQGELFGEQRLKELLAAAQGRPAGEVSQLLRTTLQAWRGAPAFDDDVTCLLVDVG
ncbi:PP2C family protein-serine/threonine phosphatase [Ramlibacter albus]|uniref:SpoIIE family protein phosphatase n=1 Tax=Ramlibacter albus TaxID=2079448 RepID=A0A923M7M6_9BURK|nr:SpoIIE family protein phosphatase [Ramlibacter albus]MBC5764219.1 SpoIIE family protein phosphatase [Ramlibacter albus]